jgi:hypothetical protein
MKTNFLRLILFLLVLPLILYSLQSCGDMGFQPSGEYISGYAIFNDSNLMHGGYYAISVYKNRANPFDTMPIRSDSLKITPGKAYLVYYRVEGLPSGDYYFGVTWIKSPPEPYLRPPVLGTLGCDTNISCRDYEIVTYPNFSGKNYNIVAFSDTTKRLF